MEDYFYGRIEIEKDSKTEKDEILNKIKRNSLAKSSSKSSGSLQSMAALRSSHGHSHSSENFKSQESESFNEDGKAIPGGRYGCA